MISIRKATSADIPAIEELEHQVWGSEGTVVFTASYFEAWLQVHPEGFLVAEVDGCVVGDIYFFLNEFDPDSPLSILSYNEGTANATSKGVHTSLGQSAYIINVTSCYPGAGRQLMSAVTEWVRTHKKRCNYGCIRVPGLASYISSLREHACLANTTDIARWYMMETARLVNKPIGPHFIQPTEAFLPLRTPDRSLGRLLRSKDWTLDACIPNYMEDEQSADFAALCVCRNPQTREGSNEPG